MKHVKMMLYGAPGVGKSVFAYELGKVIEKTNGGKVFFIATDGNYEWLEDFGAKPEDSIQAATYNEIVKAFGRDYKGYSTVVLDLVEDAFKWCESEFCVKQGIDHVSDMGYGKGYDLTRNSFFIALSKLLARPLNIILLSHESSGTVKDRRGIEHPFWKPSDKIPQKLLDSIEGRLRYVCRCYMKNSDKEVSDVTGRRKTITVTERWLSLVPKEGEFGIIRGVNVDAIPQDIPLDAKTFWNLINTSPAPVIDSDAPESVEEKSQSEENAAKVAEVKQATAQVNDAAAKAKAALEAKMKAR